MGALAGMGATFRYDEFRDRVTVQWGEREMALDSTTVARLRTELARRGISVQKDMLMDFVTAEAHAARFHPVRDYLAGLAWDGTERLGRWLISHMGAEDTPLNGEQGRLVLMAAVARAIVPGTKFDSLLILESPQRWGKSLAVRALCPDPEWFSENLPLTASPKVVLEQTAGKWICEVAELEGIDGANVEKLKALITRRADSARLAYGIMAVERPRGWVIIGTTNSAAYLKDHQNRRFWPVRLERRPDVEAIVRDRDQLWAEALIAWGLTRPPLCLSEDMEKAAATIQAERREADPWEEKLAGVYPTGREYEVKVADAMAVCLQEGDRETQKDRIRLTRAMHALGFVKRQKKRDGRVLWHYVRGAYPTGEMVWGEEDRAVPVFNPYVDMADGDVEDEPELPVEHDPETYEENA
jgi:predicted P-loop ATPase